MTKQLKKMMLVLVLVPFMLAGCGANDDNVVNIKVDELVRNITSKDFKNKSILVENEKSEVIYEKTLENSEYEVRITIDSKTGEVSIIEYPV